MTVRRQPASGGYGLSGMCERVRLAGGHFHAGADGYGWRVTARVPA